MSARSACIVANTTREWTVLQRQIDKLVYDLYELLPEERKIVGEATK